LPKVWEEKLLVVDDTDIIVELLKALLADEGVVESAVNGKEALKNVRKQYFSAIITDVDMPHMSGIDFYNNAVKEYPDIKERIIFFTGSYDEKRISFFKSNNIRYFIKPAPITEIKNAVIEILNRQS
jgi:CheY-like chemotaxis protein